MIATTEDLEETAGGPAAEEDLAPIHRLPTRAWSFLWHFVRRYYAPLCADGAAVLVGQGMETFEPYRAEAADQRADRRGARRGARRRR